MLYTTSRLLVVEAMCFIVKTQSKVVVQLTSPTRLYWVIAQLTLLVAITV